MRFFLRFFKTIILNLNEPILNRSFPRLRFVGDVFDKALGIEAEPLGSGYILIAEAAAFLRLLPELFTVGHYNHHRNQYITIKLLKEVIQRQMKN